MNVTGTTIIYPQLDYANAPGIAAGWIFGVILVVVPLLHALFYLRHLLGQLIYKYCCLERATRDKGDTNKAEELGSDNLAYEKDKENTYTRATEKSVHV